MIRAAALLLAAGCVSVHIDGEGATQIRMIGSVRVETYPCGGTPRGPNDPRPRPASLLAEEPQQFELRVVPPGSAPPRICVAVSGSSLSHSAGALIVGVLGALFGR